MPSFAPPDAVARLTRLNRQWEYREGVISSNPAVGTVEHGLTELGRVQARAAATSLIEAVSQET